jgi:hypothetical protein
MTLIERIAGDKYQITWDEAVKHQEKAKSDPDLRAMYQIIPCKHGEIYENGEGKLAFLCTGLRICDRIAKLKITKDLSWLDIFLETDEGYVFLFPLERFEMVAEWAKPNKKRRLSVEAHKKLSVSGHATRFSRRTARLNDPRNDSSPSTGV